MFNSLLWYFWSGFTYVWKDRNGWKFIIITLVYSLENFDVNKVDKSDVRKTVKSHLNDKICPTQHKISKKCKQKTEISSIDQHLKVIAIVIYTLYIKYHDITNFDISQINGPSKLKNNHMSMHSFTTPKGVILTNLYVQQQQQPINIK